MNHRDIKKEMTMQLKKEYPNWKNVSRKIKQKIASKLIYWSTFSIISINLAYSEARLFAVLIPRK